MNSISRWVEVRDRDPDVCEITSRSVSVQCLAQRETVRVHRVKMKQKMMTWTKIPHTPTDHATMNQNLRRELKMKKVQANHPVIDSKASWT